MKNLYTKKFNGADEVKTFSKGIVKDIWEKPIAKIAAFGAAMVAANKIGRALGKTSYQTGRDLSPRYKKSGR